MSKIHLDILDEPRIKTFSKLYDFRRDGYLAGGTALALQIGHRQSVDFDIFINKPVGNSLKLKIKKNLSVKSYRIDNSDILILSTTDNIELTFVWYYFKTIKPLIKTESIHLASIADIAADKAITIGRRAVWRDYADIFYLIKENILSLENILKFARLKFQEEFNDILFLEQLSYFKDVAPTQIAFLNEHYPDEEIKSFLKKEVDKITRKILK